MLITETKDQFVMHTFFGRKIRKHAESALPNMEAHFQYTTI